MTNKEMEARSRKSNELAEKIAKFVIAQNVQTDVAATAFMTLLGDAIVQTFDEQTGDDFFRTMEEFIGSRMQTSDKTFWNLMAEKGYDEPAEIPREHQTEYSQSLLKLLRLEREGALTTEMQREIQALAKKWMPKKAKAARR